MAGPAPGADVSALAHLLGECVAARDSRAARRRRRLGRTPRGGSLEAADLNCPVRPGAASCQGQIASSVVASTRGRELAATARTCPVGAAAVLDAVTPAGRLAHVRARRHQGSSERFTARAGVVSQCCSSSTRFPSTTACARSPTRVRFDAVIAEVAAPSAPRESPTPPPSVPAVCGLP